MSKQAALEEAIHIAVEKLKSIDLVERCEILGFPAPINNKLEMRVFGQNFLFDIKTFELIGKESGTPAKPGDFVLLLHYLLCDLPVKETQEQITFRDLPAGQFYLDPFLSRTVKPLLGKIRNDLELLKKNLAKFDWEPVNVGDFGAKIHALGDVYITLVYRLGDDEFPASADVIFDSSIKRIYETEDVAVLASRICIGLLF